MPDTFVGDFSKVTDRNFNIKHLPEGEYRAKITKIEDYETKDSKNPNWLYTIAITDQRGRGATYPLYCGLEENQLWKIRNLYAACGVTIPKKKVRLSRDQLKNKELGVVLEDDEYEGKMKSVIANFIPLSELADGDEADDEDEEEDEEDEEETEEEEEEEEDEEEPPPPPKKKSKKVAPAAKAKKKAKPAADDDDLEEIEIEDL